VIGCRLNTADLVFYGIARRRLVGGVDLQLLEQRADARQAVEQGPVTDPGRGEDAGEGDHVRHDGRPRAAARVARCPAPSQIRLAAILMLVSVMPPPFPVVIGHVFSHQGCLARWRGDRVRLMWIPDGGALSSRAPRMAA
jgi:hypothetical protein